LGFTFGPATAAFLFPGVDIGLAMVVGFLACIPLAIIYFQMGAAMPRSGGDYAWVTRTLHPAIGFATSWALMIGVWLYGNIVLNSYALSSFFLSSQLGVLGVLTGNTMLSQWSTLLATPMVSFVVCTAVLAVTGVISAVGMKWVRRVWTVYFVIIILGTVAMFGVLATTPASVFVSKFDSYSTALGTTYSGLMQAASTAGWIYQYSPMAAVSALPMAMMLYSGFWSSVYLGGEIKRAERSFLTSIMACLVVALIIFAGGFFLITYTSGSAFFSALAYMSFASPANNPLVVPATFPSILSILTVDNPALYWLIFIAFIADYMIFALAIYQVLSRAFFAWSFDRVLPQSMADVNERLHAPLKAIVLTFVLGEVFTAIWAVIPFALGWLNVTLAFVLILAIVGLTAAIFPFRNKAVYETSPKIVKASVVGIPVVTICGVLTFILMIAAFVYSYLTPSFSGPTSPIALVVTATLFISGFVVYYVAKTFRSRQGIDLSLVFKQVPQE
jgi:amino acid transporter